MSRLGARPSGHAPDRGGVFVISLRNRDVDEAAGDDGFDETILIDIKHVMLLFFVRYTRILAFELWSAKMR